MKKITILSVALALLATPALARTHHVRPVAPGYGHIDSGFGPPTWNDIEQDGGRTSG
jgi:hypothetical protein